MRGARNGHPKENPAQCAQPGDPNPHVPLQPCTHLCVASEQGTRHEHGGDGLQDVSRVGPGEVTRGGGLQGGGRNLGTGKGWNKLVEERCGKDVTHLKA